MASAAKLWRRRWASYPLEQLLQGSTLSIQSHLPSPTNLLIRPQWRNDGHVLLEHCRRQLKEENVPMYNLRVTKEKDEVTSLGRPEAKISLRLSPDVAKKRPEEEEDQDEDPPDTHSVPIQEEEDLNYDHQEGLTTAHLDSQPSLTIEVPEKINLVCDLPNGGSISIDNKIEGDVRLWTSQGIINVKKLRGHAITIVASTIFASHLLESELLNLAVPKDGRIRAKRIHARDLDIQVGTGAASNVELLCENATETLLDDDDAGAVCDISSLYITGDANVTVEQAAMVSNTSESTPQRQAVRIKSHHGHVQVQSNTLAPTVKNAMTDQSLPAVDLGGVNGSCEVVITSPKSEDGQTDSMMTTSQSCHVHFDSILPDSVSVIQSTWGSVNVTIDRKVEADVRLLSPPSAGMSLAGLDVETLLLEDNEDGTLADEVTHMLQYLDREGSYKSPPSSLTGEKRIRVLTKAFTEKERPELEIPQTSCYEFVDGWVENNTSEPDSRFDRKLRGTPNDTRSNLGGGKIRLEGAYNQALEGFQKGDGNGNSSKEASHFARPLLAVVAPGNIFVETLSWMGNIARRYGLRDESREADDLGRQATRRRRLDDTAFSRE